MAFSAGQSGNPYGRPASSKLFNDALRLALKRVDGDKTKLGLIAEALVEQAISGDIAAIREVADRLDGKPTQTIAGDPENPFQVVYEAGKTLDAKLERLICQESRGDGPVRIRVAQ